jgi:hypothetical protein
LGRLGVGSGLRGEAGAVAERLGLELLRSAELLGSAGGSGSQKLLLLRGGEGLAGKLLGSTLLEKLLGLLLGKLLWLLLGKLLGLWLGKLLWLLLGKLGRGLAVQLWGKAGGKGSEGPVLERLAWGGSLGLLDGLEAELDGGGGSCLGLRSGRGGSRRLRGEGKLLWLDGLLGLGKGKLLLLLRNWGWLSREAGWLGEGNGLGWSGSGSGGGKSGGGGGGSSGWGSGDGEWRSSGGGRLARGNRSWSSNGLEGLEEEAGSGGSGLGGRLGREGGAWSAGGEW